MLRNPFFDFLGFKMQSYLDDGIFPVFTMLFVTGLTCHYYLPRMQIVRLGLEEEKQHLGKVKENKLGLLAG